MNDSREVRDFTEITDDEIRRFLAKNEPFLRARGFTELADRIQKLIASPRAVKQFRKEIREILEGIELMAKNR